MPRSNKQDKYAYKAKVQTTINGQDFTVDADSRWACEIFPELGSPAEGFIQTTFSPNWLEAHPQVPNLRGLVVDGSQGVVRSFDVLICTVSTKLRPTHLHHGDSRSL